MGNHTIFQMFENLRRSYSLRSADVFPVVASLPPKTIFGGRDATTGNTSALLRLRKGRQARNFTISVPKILDLKSSSDQIFSEN